MRDSAITKILRARRSVYPTQFTGEIIADDIIEEILLNANYAPSHKLTRPWFAAKMTSLKFEWQN
jgi:nitroreductase